MTGREAVRGADLLIAHVNDDHLEQLLYCVRAFTPITAARDARVTALFPDGAEVEVCEGERVARHFIPFTAPVATPDALEQAFEATALEAMERLGVWPPRRVTTWTLRESRALTPRFRRLSFALGSDSREDWRPGDSCRFDLGRFEPGGMRPYTLRRVEGGVAELDVYVHDDTPGSRWAQGLAPGEAVTVRGERHELFPDFTRGPALLLGDETALPTLAALLETWTHAPPRVLVELADDAERAYLDGVRRPEGTALTWLTRVGEPGERLRAAVETLPFAPGAVWGASEVAAGTALRRALKAAHPDADVKLIGYWRRATG